MKRSARLARRTPMPRGKSLARGKTELRRRTRLAAVTKDAAKRAARYARQFGEKAEWIRAKPCAVCGAPGPSHAHHAETRGAGHGSEVLVPLCALCHDLFHRVGRWTFQRITGVNLVAVARRLHGEWLEYLAGARRDGSDP